MHHILHGLPFVIGAVLLIAMSVGIVIGVGKLFSWLEDVWPFGNWVVIVVLWVIILTFFAYKIGVVYEH